MSPKRRILVVFKREGSKDLKLAVSIDGGATNSALAHEIAETVGEQAVRLEVGDGFELRGQDAVDVILDSDVVTARPHNTQTAVTGPTNSPDSSPSQIAAPQPSVPASNEPSTKRSTPPPSYRSLPPTKPMGQAEGEERKEPARFQIRLVTADLARAYAKETLTESTEPTNGMLAFDAEFVSGNTTVSALRREAARMFGWISDDDALDDGPCDHATTSSCSCAIAREVEQHGLFSTLHCRFTVDGTKCSNDGCPYSHAQLLTGAVRGIREPYCSVCTDALAQLCPSCLEKAQESDIKPDSIMHCPVVQNAGCGHVHHAHCLGPRKDSSPVGCPSGCSLMNVHREAIPFDHHLPSIILVWDGDKIDRIPIPLIYLPASGTLSRLTSDVVFNLVEEFLAARFSQLGGLSLRIHARDPATETVSFTWTTLVSALYPKAHCGRGLGTFASISTLHNCRSDDLCGNATVTLYVVKRTCYDPEHTPAHRAVGVSKQSTYLLGPAWQPSTPQTNRGMAALLSSLFVLSHIISKKGIASENTVLAALYGITRFPPAVRALGLLLLNATLQPQEKAALSEALFRSLKDFASTAPVPVAINPARRFETARIFLGHILTVKATETTRFRILESFSLVCSLSQKRLVDPVLLDSCAVVDRTAALHFIPGGVLYRPQYAVEERSVADLSQSELRQVLAQTSEFFGSEIYALRLHDIWPLTRPRSLERAGSNFSNAIRETNETDLIARGPLELKSPAVVPPQIVLDEEGYLAVFTGRGCGTNRDVNFFRPTVGGDTEVDVNAVEFALQKIIESRQLEGTWEIDRFGGIPAKARTPDEAIVLCLDLSQSMNEKSAVGGSGSTGGSTPTFNYDAEASKAVTDVVKNYTAAAVLLGGRDFVKEQHESCHLAWKSLIEGELSSNEVITHLGTIARREVLRIHSEGIGFSNRRRLVLFACFASAVDSQRSIMLRFFEDFLRDFQRTPTVGAAPYDVPRNLVDPTTGDLTTVPASSLSRWSFSFTSNTQTWRAQWVEGRDLLNELNSNGPYADTITVTLNHNGTVSSWKLPAQAPTRTLYSLANRATHARYSSFTVRMSISKTEINDSTTLPIGSTDLGNGGTIELSRLVPHSRKLHEIVVTFPGSDETQTFLLPADAPVLALISRILTPNGDRLSEIQLWHGLWDAGDGHQFGTSVEIDSRVGGYPTLACDWWQGTPQGSLAVREESRSLSRLELMKVLFNNFLNRASSFDTSVSLVLGLVIFSDQARITQQLTAVFENFRLQLDAVEARGDTAMYDALDLARSCLVAYGRDLSHLRRRIVVVSDGEDTSSKCGIDEVGFALQRDNIIVDSIQVGQTHSRVLHAFSAATGGYRFFPKTSLGDALSIFDLETMMYSAERPPRLKAQGGMSRSLYTLSLHAFPIDIVTIDRYPQRAPHPRLQEPVRDVKKATVPAPSNDRTKRIMRELTALVTDPHPQIDVYVNDEDMSFLKVVIQAPDDIDQCPYKGGCFLLTCDLPAEYPRDPPEIRFVTFILHPNVSKQGKVCIAELGRLWASDITLKEIFTQIYGLLLEPDLDNPLEIQASLKYYDDDGTFAHAAAIAVEEHASKPRSEWRKELEV
ncbi:hypothetical protein LshimejAT787_0603980 [Lyophyllum shimeji]|uniref:UBC core domain-containing protein n=1 Tax=Lyophyllum shimeji TaxID=47721 RepID=A0A9P3UQH7_LYOSH|nr:hypothetical protein LshimejAT787_0603980 [Lyophyllum shimeji]